MCIRNQHKVSWAFYLSYYESLSLNETAPNKTETEEDEKTRCYLMFFLPKQPDHSSEEGECKEAPIKNAKSDEFFHAERIAKGKDIC